MLPQFFIKSGDTLYTNDNWELLKNSDLINGFKLGNEDCKIDFTTINANLAEVDVKDNNNATYNIVTDYNNAFRKAFANTKNKDDFCLNEIAGKIDKDFNELAYDDIKEYVKRVIDAMDTVTRSDIEDDPSRYIDKIKDKINSLMATYRKGQFKPLLDTNTIKLMPYYKFKEEIHPTHPFASLTKSLYEKEEGDLNEFEQGVISKVVSLDNIKWWHRNISRHGFFINTYINAYPDFIICTKKNCIIALETKGGQLVENKDSLNKADDGEIWQNKAGENYRYFMVTDNTQSSNSRVKSVDEFIKILKVL